VEFLNIWWEAEQQNLDQKVHETNNAPMLKSQFIAGHIERGLKNKIIQQDDDYFCLATSCLKHVGRQ
jgi:hypothetical protein